MLLSCSILILLLLVSLWVLSLPLVRCCCSFFCICHSYFNLIFLYPILICRILFLLPFPVPDVIYLLLSIFNLSQMLEFDDSCKLVATSLLQVSSQMKNLFPIFLPFFLVIGGFFLLPIMAYR